MKISGQVGGIEDRGIERAFGPSIRAFPQENIAPGKQVDTLLVIPEWGIRGIRATGGGQIALIPDETKKLTELVQGFKLVYRFQHPDKRKRAQQVGVLSPPRRNARKGSVEEFYHTRLNQKLHNGIEFFDLREGFRLTIDVYW